MKSGIAAKNGFFRKLGKNELEFLSSRIMTCSSQKNEMVSSEWKEYLRIKRTENFSQESLKNFADPNYKLTYGLYGGTTNDKITLAHRLYHEDNIYQELIQIKEPDIGNPPKKFAIKNQLVSGNFLRQVYFAYKLLKKIKNPPKVILEIGGGYGLLTYLLKTLFPQCKIIIIDIPETILLQYYFLSNVFPNLNIGHVSWSENQEEKKIATGDLSDITLVECKTLNLLDVKPDVVLVLASLQEMVTHVVNYYVGWLEANIQKGGFFYMYNCYGMDSESYKNPAQIPLDSKWNIIHLEQATLIEDDYRHLEVIFQRRDNANSQWNQKKDSLQKYYDVLRAWDHQKMEYFSHLILNDNE